MKRTVMVMALVALAVAAALPAVGQTTNRVVTVTLVRWPYT